MFKGNGIGKIEFPRIGMRIIKTSISIFICFVVFILRGQDTSPLYALIAAIISMQTDVENSIKAAANRTIGTFIGGLIGTIVLLTIQTHMDSIPRIYSYLLISIAVIPVIYFTVLIKKPGSTAIACTVFFVITVSTSDMNAVYYSINRIIDTLVGIFVSLFINLIKMPRFNKQNILFVLGLEDLLVNKQNKITSTTVVKINQVISRGGIITFASENTPSLFLGSVKDIAFKYPVIAMNGSAIYDIAEKSYLKTWEIQKDEYEKVKVIIEDNGFHAFVRAVKNDVLCIFYKDFTNSVQQELFEVQHKMSDKFYIFGELAENYHPLNLLINDSHERIQFLANLIREAQLNVELHVADDMNNKGYSRLGIYAKGVSKGSALEYLKGILNIDGVIAFGKRESDLSMFSVSDHSYVMADCPEALRENSNELISGNSDNVSRKIRKIFLYGIDK